MLKKILILCFLLAAVLLPAREFEQHLNKPSEIFVGTPIHLMAKFQTGLNDSIFMQEADTLDVFIVHSITDTSQVIDNIKHTEINIKLAAYDTGEYTLPPFNFTVKKGENLREYSSSEYLLFIETILPDSVSAKAENSQGELPPIADIDGLYKMQLGWLDYLLPALILVVLIWGIIYLIKKLSRNKAGEELAEIIPTDTRPAYEIALEMLAKLKMKKYLEAGNYLEFHFGLSYILRAFLEKQYQVNTLEMTTSEIRSALKIKPAEKSQILAMLSFDDKIKFAKYTPP